MANNTMGRVDILTVKQRSNTIIERFWKQHGFQPVFWDNTNKMPGVGRNIILNNFYNSDRKWLVIADDDVIIDTARGDGKTFLQNIDQILNAIGDEITSFGVMNNIVHRVATTLKNPIVKDNWVWMRSYSFSNIFFHKKTQNIPFSETYMLEDQEWCMDQLCAKQRCATLMNIAMKSIDNTSLLFRDNKDRIEQYQQAKQHWFKKYPTLKTDTRNRVRKTALINQYWPTSLNWKSVKDIGVCFRIPK